MKKSIEKFSEHPREDNPVNSVNNNNNDDEDGDGDDNKSDKLKLNGLKSVQHQNDANKVNADKTIDNGVDTRNGNKTAGDGKLAEDDEIDGDIDNDLKSKSTHHNDNSDNLADASIVTDSIRTEFIEDFDSADDSVDYSYSRGLPSSHRGRSDSRASDRSSYRSDGDSPSRASGRGSRRGSDRSNSNSASREISQCHSVCSKGDNSESYTPMKSDGKEPTNSQRSHRENNKDVSFISTISDIKSWASSSGSEEEVEEEDCDKTDASSKIDASAKQPKPSKPRVLDAEEDLNALDDSELNERKKAMEVE